MSYIQSASKDSGSVTSDTLGFGSNNAAGSTSCVGVRVGAVGRTLTVSDSRSNTYAQTAAASDGSDDAFIAYAQNITAGANTVTAGISGAAATVRWWIAEYGQAASSFDKTAGAGGTGTSASSGATAATTQATETLVGLICAANAQTDFTPGTSYTKREEVVASGQLKIGLEDRDVSATGTYAADATLNGASGAWAAIIVTLKAVVGGGGFFSRYYYDMSRVAPF